MQYKLVFSQFSENQLFNIYHYYSEKTNTEIAKKI